MQYYINFRCATQCIDIYIPPKVITLINLVFTCRYI